MSLEHKNSNLISESALVKRWGCSKGTVYRKTRGGAVSHTVVDGEKMFSLSDVINIESTSPVRSYGKRKAEVKKRKKYRKRRTSNDIGTTSKPYAPPFLTRFIMLFDPTYGGFFSEE
jgi:hypothetical protein